MRLISLLFIGLLTLAGCGQKGPLYLPEAPQTNETAQPTEPVPAQDDASL